MEKIPQNIGFILDGNRRWAQARNLPTLIGHRQGLEKLKECVRWVQKRGIQHMVVFAFSTENWKRTEQEVSYLLELIEEAISNEAAAFIADGIRIKIVGERERFSESLQKSVANLEAESAANTGLTLWVCLSYGGRAEIVAAAKAATDDGVEITEETLGKYLWTSGMPDPDIVVRTGAQQRISNFLLWQSAYSEIYFSETMWPDFSEKELDVILEEFARRKRNFGV